VRSTLDFLSLVSSHIYAENAHAKSKKGLGRYPNKKRNKKATLAQKKAADAVGQQHVAALQLLSPPLHLPLLRTAAGGLLSGL